MPDNSKKKSIEEQVAELTEEQKETILKVSKYGGIVMAVVTIPIVLLAFLGLLIMITDPLMFTDQATIGYFTFIVLGMTAILSILVFIKIKFPFYSDKKASYIKKNRKS